MRRSVVQALVAQPGKLAPPRPPGNVTVSPQQPLGAGTTRFGPVSPGITTSSRFTGGTSGHPVSPGMHPAAAPGFQAPTYPSVPGAHMAPVLSALAATGAASGGTPGIGPTSLPPGAPGAPPLHAPAPGSTVGPSTGTTYPAGWWNPETNPTVPWTGEPTGTLASTANPLEGGYGPARTSGGLIAALATRGMKRSAYQV